MFHRDVYTWSSRIIVTPARLFTPGATTRLLLLISNPQNAGMCLCPAGAERMSCIQREPEGSWALRPPFPGDRNSTSSSQWLNKEGVLVMSSHVGYRIDECFKNENVLRCSFCYCILKKKKESLLFRIHIKKNIWGGDSSSIPSLVH